MHIIIHLIPYATSLVMSKQTCRPRSPPSWLAIDDWRGHLVEGGYNATFDVF